MGIFDNSAEVVAAAAAEAKTKREDLLTQLEQKFAGAVAGDVRQALEQLEQLILDQVRAQLVAEIRANLPGIGALLAPYVDAGAKQLEDDALEATDAEIKKLSGN